MKFISIQSCMPKWRKSESNNKIQYKGENKGKLQGVKIKGNIAGIIWHMINF
jgi:hypothetical protein